MDFFSLTEHRHSTRSYLDRPVEPEKLQRLLQAVNRAPSAGNLQAYEIVLVRDPARKWKLASAAGGQEFLAQAPVVLVFCAHPARSSPRYAQRGERLYSVQDATIACTYAMLAATELGLASVWIGAFQDEAVSAALNLSEAWRPVAMLPVGYAAQPGRPTPRRELADLVHEV
jgi:nitroreductase